MPTYRYRRPDGSTFDVIQKISDPPLTEDPETGEPVERVISGGAGLQFKGSGFYLTDYAKKSGGESGESKDGGSKKKETAAKASDTGSASPATTAPAKGG